LSLAVFVAITGFQLFGPVPIGLADNGDFARILGPLALWPAAAARDDPRTHFKYFVNDYVVAYPRYDPGIPSSEWLVAALAKRIARIILRAGTFHLALMGLVHAAVMTLALFILLHALRSRPFWLRCICSLLILFIWTDIKYVQQFNTAYTDAGAVVALAVLFSIMIYCELVTADAWAAALVFVLFGCFLLATKTQHETALPFLIGFCVLAVVRARHKFARTIWLGVPVLLIGTSVWMLSETPREYRAAPAFTLIFYKLAVLSTDPKGVLQDFRMPEDEFLKYVGHFAYEPQVPIEDPAFRRRLVSLVTPSTLGKFYLHHPAILKKVLLLDLIVWAPDVKLSEYGHLLESDVQSGKLPFELVAWSWVGRHALVASPFSLISFFGAVVVLSGVCILSRRIAAWFPIWPITLLLAFLAIASFLFASLTDAVETSRHLVFFQAATDLTIFSMVLSALLGIDNRGSPHHS